MEVDDERPKSMPFYREIDDEDGWSSEIADEPARPRPMQFSREIDDEGERTTSMPTWEIADEPAQPRPMPLKPYSRQSFHSPSSDFFSDGNSACKNGQKQITVDYDEVLSQKTLPEFPCSGTGCSKLFTSIYDHEVHFRSVHSIFCNECHMTFPSYNLLDYHIEENHEEHFGSEKLGFVFTFSCIVDGCKESFKNGTWRNEHVISVHKYPPNFNFPSTHGAGIKPKVAVSITDAEMAARVFTDRSHKLKPRHHALEKTSSFETTPIELQAPCHNINMSDIKRVMRRTDRPCI